MPFGDALGVNAKVMNELGYTVLVKDEQGNPTKAIDWSKTKAIASRTCHIYLNLKGRNPHGIVDPADQYALEDEIISALYNYRDEYGRRIISLAIRNKEAVHFGLSGDKCGDIIYLLVEGPNKGHCDTWSTAYGYFDTSVSPIFIAAGAGLKQGYSTSRVIRQVDVAPTIAAFLGVRMPAQCEGAPAYQIFAGLAMVLFPFLGWDLMTIGTVSAATGVTMSYTNFMIVVWPALIVFCIVYVLFMKYILRCDASKLSEITLENTEKTSIQKNQKYILILIALYLVACTFVGLFTGTTGIRLISSSLGIYGVTLIIIILMTIIKTEDGPLLNPMKCTQYVFWDTYFLIVSALLLANQLTGPNTGVSAWAVQVMSPIFNNLGEIGFLVVLSIATVILTNIGNNLAVGFTLLSIISVMCNAGMQFNVIVAAVLVTVLCLFGFLFPASSIGGALIHANEWTTPATIYKYITLSLLLGMVVVLLIIIPFGCMLL